jgi:hypothetical protein
MRSARLWYNPNRLIKYSAVDRVMTHPNSHAATAAPNPTKIARRGQDLYNRSIRSQVEQREQIGKIIAIDLNTGNYEIDENLLEAIDRLRSQLPDAVIWSERIGFNAVYAVGGSLTKVDLA